MSSKPIFVATHPRACSTAFERVFMTRRNSLQTVHEPFGDAFYFGPERMGSRYENDEKAREESGFAQSTFKTVLDRLDEEAREGKRVFIKDIIHYIIPPHGQEAHLAPSLQRIKRGVGTDGDLPVEGQGADLKVIANNRDSGVLMRETDSPPKSPPFPYDSISEPNNPTVIPRDILERFHFTFLIRNPRNAVPSYYRCCVAPLVERTNFQDFMPCEAGYDELRRLFDYCKAVGMIGPKVCGRDEPVRGEASGGVEICVVDADDLLDDPESIIRQYCKSVGLDFRPEMLEWNTEEDHAFARSQFQKWDGFHDDAINSKDLKPRQHKRKPKSDEQLYEEWTKQYGQQAADVIKQTVEKNTADYEYLKQFAIRTE